MPDDGGDDEKEKEEDDPDDGGVNGGPIHRSNVDFNISRDVFSHAEAEKKVQEEEEKALEEYCRDDADEESSHAATVTRLEEANRRNEHLEEELCSLEDAKAEATTLDVKVKHLSNEVRAAHAKCKENEGMLEDIAKENEELVWLADLRSNHVRTLVFERNQAKSELEQLRLERSTMNAEVVDQATLIPSPIDFEDLNGLFMRSFNQLKFHNHNVPPLIMREISKVIYNVDPCRRIRNNSYQELHSLGIDCPPKNEETMEQILGATVVETTRFLLRFINYERRCVE